MKLGLVLLCCLGASLAAYSGCTDGIQALLAPLANYPPALSYCKARFPPATVTVVGPRKRATTTQTTRPQPATTQTMTTRATSSSKQNGKELLLLRLFAIEYGIASRFCSCHQVHSTVTKTTSIRATTTTTTKTTPMTTTSTTTKSASATTTSTTTSTTMTSYMGPTCGLGFEPCSAITSGSTYSACCQGYACFTTAAGTYCTRDFNLPLSTTTTTTLITTTLTTTTTTTTTTDATLTVYTGPTCGPNYADCQMSTAGSTYSSCCQGYTCFITGPDSYCQRNYAVPLPTTTAD